ncbi:MAG: hypothetical protein HRT66_08230 [Flavobacteriaceae bacterium]|nr:hypothetical protein [Flavobacteriaceae bacterium]
MNKNYKEMIYKINEFSFGILLTRIIAIGVSVYFIFNFNNDPSFSVIIILFLGFIVLISTRKKSITATKLGIQTKEFNLLNIFTKKEFISYKNISNIEFTPSKFSITMFLLNTLIYSGNDSNKQSILKIKMKDGKEIDLKNIGDKLDAENLNKIILKNK